MIAEAGVVTAGRWRVPQRFAADWRVALLAVLIVAISTRIISWWNPVAHVDDQFYLFVGDRMLHGEWPYVDIWDRKPLGLFALYALIAKIGGGTIFAVNIAATMCVIATAMMIRRLAMFFASPLPATCAALCYILNLPLFGGQNGQSPVFYNLLIAIAALQLLKFAENLTDRSWRRPLTAMLMCGLALTIKTVCVFEGTYFGLTFLFLYWRREASIALFAGLAATMVAVAIAPFALTAIPYLLRGHDATDTFVFANFVSIFVKATISERSKIFGALYVGIYGSLIITYAAVGTYLRRNDGTTASRFLVGWQIAAIIGYFSVPNLFDHYFLPVMLPMAVSASTLFGKPIGLKLFIALAIACLVQRPIWEWKIPIHSKLEFERISAKVRNGLNGGCLYVAAGPPLLYAIDGACRLTRYSFPDHLLLRTEQGAIGIDRDRKSVV